MQIEGVNQAAGKKHEENRDRINHYYQRYKETGNLSAFLIEVREMAYNKLYRLEYQFAKFGSADTVDDWSQDIVMKVMEKLPKYDESKGEFYYWLQSLIYNDGNAIANRLAGNTQADENATPVAKGKKKMGRPEIPDFGTSIRSKAPLEVQIDASDDEDAHEADNPEMHRSEGYYRTLDPIPAEVQGEDRYMLDLIGAGKSYAEVAEWLEVSEDVIKKRIQRIRKQFKGLREEQKKASAELARQNTDSMRYKMNRHRAYIEAQYSKIRRLDD